jgi:hypothetical protein
VQEIAAVSMNEGGEGMNLVACTAEGFVINNRQIEVQQNQ